MNLKINENCGKIELHIKNNWLKYALMLSVFVVGIIIGGICFTSFKNNDEDMIMIKELLEQTISDIDTKRWMLINEYFLKDIKNILLLTIVSSSMIGLPLLLIWIFYDGLTLSFTIGNIIFVYGMLKGNLISLFLLFLPNLFYLIAIMIISVSSIKLINNFLKMRKSFKIETIRHLIVCAFSAIIIIIAFFTRIFSMNLVENMLKI